MMRRVDIRPTATAGFSLIELLIGMLLLGILFAAVMPIVGNLLNDSKRAIATEQSAGELSVVYRQLEDDFRNAWAPGRATGDNAAVETVIRSLHLGGTNAANRAQNHDLQFVSPRAVQLWTDVMGDELSGAHPGADLVTWALVLNDADCTFATEATNWCVVRQVQGGGTGPVISEIVASGSGLYPISSRCDGASGSAATTWMFCFAHSGPANNNYLGSWNENCATRWTDPVSFPSTWNNEGAGNANITVLGQTIRGYNPAADRIAIQHQQNGPNVWAGATNPTIASTDRITTVRIAAPSGARSGKQIRSSVRVTDVDIDSRLSAEYQNAIACGSRGGSG